MLQYTLVGLVVGGIYAMASVGIVSTFISAGVLNFAYGSLAFFVARLYYFLHTQHRWSIPLAGLASIVVAGPLIGVALWALLFRYLAQSSTLTRVVVTIGLSVGLPPLAAVLFGNQAIPSAPGLAPEPVHVFHVDGVPVTMDQLLVLAATLILLVAGAAALRLTPAGLLVRGVADSSVMASLSGVNPQVVAAGVWALSLFLAGLSGVLMAPIIGLSSPNYTLLMAAAFAAVVVARLRSMSIAFVAALALGWVGAAAQKLLPPASSVTQNVLPAIPFGFVLVFLVVYSLRADRRPEKVPPLELARILSSERRIPKARVGRRDLAGLGRVVMDHPGATAIFVAIGILPLALRGLWPGLVGEGVAIGLVFLSYTVITGEGGFLSLCQISVAGLGAIAAAQLATVYGVPVLLACVIGALAMAPVGALIGVLTLRLGDLYVALVTLTIGLVVENIVFSLPRFFQQGLGVALGRPQFATSDRAFTYLVLAAFAVSALAVVRFRSSTTGWAVGAVRWSEPGAQTIGVSVVRAKLTALILASVLAGLGGSLYAMYAGAVTGANYVTFEGLVLLTVLVAAGIRPVAAALLAGVTFIVLPALVLQYLPTAWGNVPPILFGLGAIGVVRQPSGWMLEARQRWATRMGQRTADRTTDVAPMAAPEVAGRPVRLGSSPGPAAPASHPIGDGPVLAAQGLTVRFGGITALSDVDLHVPSGSVIGLIGPNGAGKTTLFAALSGLVHPQSGSVQLAGHDATGLSPEARVRLGLARTFQHPEVFATLTVREHLALAYRAKFAASPLWAGRSTESRTEASAGEEATLKGLMAELGLESVEDTTVAGLPLGTVRRVEVGRALAGSPSVLLLDEPSSGLDRHEAEVLAETLAAARRATGVAVVVVEHDVEFVMGLADDVVVLDHGTVIAQGSPEAVRADPAVLEAYLGVRR